MKADTYGQIPPYHPPQASDVFQAWGLILSFLLIIFPFFGLISGLASKDVLTVLVAGLLTAAHGLSIVALLSSYAKWIVWKKYALVLDGIVCFLIFCVVPEICSICSLWPLSPLQSQRSSIRTSERTLSSSCCYG